MLGKFAWEVERDMPASELDDWLALLELRAHERKQADLRAKHGRLG